MPVLRLPCAFPPHFVSFAWRYHRPHHLFVPPAHPREVGPVQAWMLSLWPPISQIATRWSSSGLPGSWGVLSYFCPAHKTPAAPPCHSLPSQQDGIAPATLNTKAATINPLSRLIHKASVPAVYASSFGLPTLARLASDRVTALIGWDSNPLDSFSKFQVWLSRHLFQRSRLSWRDRG